MKKLLSIALLGGALLLTGCGDSQESFVFTNTQVVVAPVCVDDAYQVNANTTLTVAAANGVLANDAVNGAVVAFPTTSAQGGTVAGNADGSFVFTPAANFTGPDTFDYTLTNSAGAVTCTVTITVNVVNGFFVDAATGNDGTGGFTNGTPFASIQAAIAAAPAGSDIVVRPGNYTGAITLRNGDRLLGSGSVLAQGTPIRPTLTGPIDLADGCTVDFIRIDGTAGAAIDGSGQNSGTVANCEIANTTGGFASGLGANNASGTWIVSDNVMDNIGGPAVLFRTTGASQLSVQIDGNQITGGDAGAVSLVSENTSSVRAFVTGNTFRNNNQNGGVAFELTHGDQSTFCLDLENNINDADNDTTNADDGVYQVLGTATLRIEELTTLTDPQPGGAGNTGTFLNNSTSTVQNINDGDCAIP